MSSSLENFISEVTNRGLARTNLFSVEIPTPACIPRRSAPTFLNLFCQTASFPPTNIGVRDLRISGPTYKRPYNVDYGGEGISMTFLIDRDMELKKYFDKWMSYIVNPYEYYVYYDENDTKYTTDITVKQIKEIVPGKKFYENNGYESITPAEDIADEYIIVIQDAFPRNIGMIELDTTAQNATHKLTVNFAYRKVIFNPGSISVRFADGTVQ
jgi:hypothetical protein